MKRICKLFILLFLSLLLEYVLIYILMPEDIYHETSSISQALIGLVEFINIKLPLFPSSLVYFIRQQKVIGVLNYIPYTAFFLSNVIFFVGGGRKRRENLLIFLSFFHPLIYIETIYRLSHYDLHSFIISPLLIAFLTLRSIYFQRNFLEYLELSVLFALYLLFGKWIALLEDIAYNKLFLLAIPLTVFDRLNIFLFVLLLSIFFLPLYKNFIKINKLIAGLAIFYFILSGFSYQTTTLNGKTWSGRWIWANENKNDQYLIFEKEFILPGLLITKGSIDITAKSAYKLYINNHFIGEGPGPIDEKSLYFDSYVLDTYLIGGKNTLKIIAYNYGHDTHFQNKQNGGVLGEIHLFLGNRELTIGTDKTWKMYEQTGYLPINVMYPQIKENEVNSGKYVEIYEFKDHPKTYLFPHEYTVTPDDHLVSRPIPYLLHENILPLEKIQTDKEVSFDFGNVVVGYPLIEIVADKDSLVQIKYFEDRNTSSVQENILIFPKSGKYFYRTFGRKGFQLASVYWKKGKGTINLFAVDSVRFPSDKIGSFQSSDELLGDIYSLGKRTLKYAMQDQFEDSFVHERSQYLGDSYVDMLSGFYSFDTRLLAKKALYQFASTQKQNGIIETVYPSSLKETILSFNLMYASFLKDYFFYTNDLATVNELIPKAARILEAFEMIKDKNGILDARLINNLHPGEILAGWLNHTRADDPSPNLTISLNALYFKELDSLTYLFTYIDPNRSNFYRNKKENFRRAFLNYISTWSFSSFEPHAAVLLINSDLLDQTTEKKIYDAVLRNSSPFITGYFNLFYLEAMQKVGDAVGVKNLLYRYWGDMIREGAKTTWETYDTRDKSRSLSKTHAWASGPTYFLPAFVTGLRPISPGFESILLQPLFITDTLSTKISLVCGDLNVEMSKSDNLFKLSISNPCQRKIVIKLPFLQNQVKELLVNNQQVKPSFETETLVFPSSDKSLTMEIFLGRQ